MRPFTRLVIVSLALAYAPSWGAQAGGGGGRDRVSGPIDVEIMRVHDGDSFLAIAHMWPRQFVETQVRVAGVDTPEIRGRCGQEKKLAHDAKELTEKFLKSGAPITIRNVSLDKFGGRVDADVHNAKGESLARALIRANLARAYHGGTKRGWC